MKRNVSIVLLLIVISFQMGAQSSQDVIRLTQLEQVVFDRINVYRVSMGCKAIKWSDDAYKAAYMQSFYLSNPDTDISHFEEKDLPDFDEINSPCDRIGSVLNSPGVVSVENIITIQASDRQMQKRIENGKAVDGVMRTADAIVGGWRNSHDHNKNLLDKRVNYGAVAIVREKNGMYCRPVMVFFRK